MKKIISSLVVSGLCANGACFGMNGDLTKNKVGAITESLRKNQKVKKINRKVRRIKRVNDRKVRAVLGTSMAVAGSALAYHYLKATKNPTVNIPVSDILGDKVNFLTKALNFAKNHPVATSLTTIGGLASIAVATAYFMKSEKQENKNIDEANSFANHVRQDQQVLSQNLSENIDEANRFVNQVLQNQQNLSENLDQMLSSLEFRKEMNISKIDEIEKQCKQIKESIQEECKQFDELIQKNSKESDREKRSKLNGLLNAIDELELKIVFFRKVHNYLRDLSSIEKSIENSEQEEIRNKLSKISNDINYISTTQWTALGKYYDTGMSKLNTALNSVEKKIQDHQKPKGTEDQPNEESSNSTTSSRTIVGNITINGKDVEVIKGESPEEEEEEIYNELIDIDNQLKSQIEENGFNELGKKYNSIFETIQNREWISECVYEKFNLVYNKITEYRKLIAEYQPEFITIKGKQIRLTKGESPINNEREIQQELIKLCKDLTSLSGSKVDLSKLQELNNKFDLILDEIKDHNYISECVTNNLDQVTEKIEELFDQNFIKDIKINGNFIHVMKGKKPSTEETKVFQESVKLLERLESSSSEVDLSKFQELRNKFDSILDEIKGRDYISECVYNSLNQINKKIKELKKSIDNRNKTSGKDDSNQSASGILPPLNIVVNSSSGTKGKSPNETKFITEQ